MIFIGIDGGGTKTAAAAYENGKLLAEAVAGPMNYNFIGVEKAVGNLMEAIGALGIPFERIDAIGIGDPSIDEGMSAGELSEQFAEAVRRTLGTVYIRSDAYMTLFGLGKRPAVLTLSGTGAMSVTENARGEILTAGGWGRLTGDEGSGYYIALESVKAALRAADGIIPPTALTDAVLEYFGAKEPRELIGIFYGENCPDISGFAKTAAACAETDITARGILVKAAEYLAAYTARLVRWSGAEIVGVYGSVICRNRIVRQEFERLVKKEFPDIAITEPPVSATRAAADYAAEMFQERKVPGT